MRDRHGSESRHVGPVGFSRPRSLKPQAVRASPFANTKVPRTYARSRWTRTRVAPQRLSIAVSQRPVLPVLERRARQCPALAAPPLVLGRSAS